MKLVKEYINEVFSKSEDKLSSLGVGKVHQIKLWIEELLEKCDDTNIDSPDIIINGDFTLNVIGNLFLPNGCGDLPDYIQFNEVGKTFNCVECDLTTLRGCPKIVHGDYICDNNHLTSLEFGPIYVMTSFLCGSNRLSGSEIRKFKEKLNITKNAENNISEEFIKNSDKLSSLNIGRTALIKKWIENLRKKCDEDRIDAPNITLNPDNTLDVHYNLFIPDNFGDMPEYIQFNKVGGHFNCKGSELTTLRGCPRWVNKDYICDFNRLTSLEFGPDFIGGCFTCSNNYELSIKEIERFKKKLGADEERINIDEGFVKHEDKLNSLDVGKRKMIENWIDEIKELYSVNSLFPPEFNINDDLTIDIDGDFGLPDNCGNLPTYIQFNRVNGNFNVCNCDLTTLRGCPRFIEGSFFCNNNHLTSLKFAPIVINGRFECDNNDINNEEKYNYIKNLLKE